MICSPLLRIVLPLLLVVAAPGRCVSIPVAPQDNGVTDVAHQRIRSSNVDDVTTKAAHMSSSSSSSSSLPDMVDSTTTTTSTNRRLSSLSYRPMKRLFQWLLNLVNPTRPAPVPVPAPPSSLPAAPVAAPVLAPKQQQQQQVPDPVVPVAPPTNVDTTPPKLVKLIVFNRTINVTLGPASTIVELTVQDDRLLSRAKVYVTAPDTITGPSPFIFDVEAEYTAPRTITTTNTGSSSSGNKAVTFNLTLTFPALIQGGEYGLTILLWDTAYNAMDLYPADLAKLKFPSFIQVVNARPDVSPPTVLQFVATSPTKVDVYTKQATVSFRLQVQDVGFGIDSASLVATGNGRQINSYWYHSSLDTATVGRQALVFNLTFPAHLKPATFLLQLQVQDANYNTVIMNATKLAGLGFPSTIVVANAVPDLTPPRLLNLTDAASLSTSSRRVINVSDSSADSARFTMELIDDQIGVYDLCLLATYSVNRSLTDCPNTHPYVIKGRFSHLFDFYFGRDSWRRDYIPNPWRGVYKLSAFLRDDNGNQVTIRSEELQARGFPSSFTVV